MQNNTFGNCSRAASTRLRPLPHLHRREVLRRTEVKRANLTHIGPLSNVHRNPEVAYEDAVVVGEEEVGGLHIAVDDAEIVDIAQAFQHVLYPRQRTRLRRHDMLPLEALRQVAMLSERVVDVVPLRALILTRAL